MALPIATMAVTRMGCAVSFSCDVVSYCLMLYVHCIFQIRHVQKNCVVIRAFLVLVEPFALVTAVEFWVLMASNARLLLQRVSKTLANTVAKITKIHTFAAALKDMV